MRKDRDKALRLRLEGKSYNEISVLLKVPKSTLSSWFGGLVLSSEARERINRRVAEGTLRGLIKRNKNQTHLAIQRMHTGRQAGCEEIGRISPEQLRLIGAALYWAEGYKRLKEVGGKTRTHHPVALSNADPILAKVFMRFLREVCHVPDKVIRIEARLYKHMNKEEIIKFWMSTLGLTKENFKNVYFGISKSSQGKRPYNRLPYGTIQIRVNDTVLFHRIMGWIEGVQKQCMAG
ncbi:MAG: hypothetical protein Q7S48_05330 [bacterium]|nr:hypothetical protein [bacterium]